VARTDRPGMADEESSEEDSPHGNQAIPYHALLCEILSSLLGVRCFSRLAVSALLTGKFASAVDEIIADFLDDNS